MVGIFDVLNLLIGSAYPIIASFQAYDNYSSIATKTGATTFTVRGVSIPLGTILKKATATDAQIEEDTLNFRLLTVQMWLIYWIVNAAICASERILCLSWFPLYSSMRCMLSIWLLAPIAVSNARLKSSQVLSFNDVQKEWADFSDQGCGLVYFKYLRPFIKDHVGILSKFSVEPLLAYISDLLVLPMAQQVGLLTLFTSHKLLPQSAKYTEKISDISKLFSVRTSDPGHVPTSFEDISEYDVIDKPGANEELPTKNRGNKQEFSANDIPESLSSAIRSSWFW